MRSYAAVEAIGSSADELAKDPICGMMVKKAGALSTQRGGRTYFFCSPTCQRTFEDPERELKSMRTRVTIALTGVLVLAILRAAAFIALCTLNPGVPERTIARLLREASPTAYPNRLLVTLADAALERTGRMIEAVESIGRGLVANEAHPFSLPANLSALQRP